MRQNKLFLLATIISLFLIASVSAGEWNSTSSNGLISYNNFNSDGSDVSGNGHDCFGNAVHSNVGGINGGYYSFDSQFLDCVGLSNNLTSDFTLSFWVNASNIYSFKGIITMLSSDVSNNYAFHVSAWNPSQIGFEANPSGGYVDGSNSPMISITPEQWMQIVLTYDGTAFSIYANGVLVKSLSKTGTFSYTGNPNLTIGQHDEEGHYPFVGGVDEVSLYNRAWSLSEVQSSYDGGAGTFYSEEEPAIEPIEVEIVYPENIIYTTAVSTLDYTYNSTSPDKCWYSTNGGLTNSTPVVAGVNFTGISYVQGSNTWSLYCNDTAGNLDADDNVTFFVDTISPSVTILSPLNQSYNTTMDENYADLSFSVSISESGSCVYSFDRGVTNYSMTASLGDTRFDDTASILNGSWAVTYYCRDDNFLSNSSSVSFRIVPIVSEGQNETEPPITSNEDTRSLLTSVGAGLGIFIIFLGQALPPLLIGIAFVIILVLVGSAIVKRIFARGKK